MSARSHPLDAPSRPAVTPMAISPGHGASLATTAGITSVITGVMAAGLCAQVPAAAPAHVAACAGGAIAALAIAAGALYEARNALGAALDAAASDPGRAPLLAAYAQSAYHLGMACVFAGLGLAAAWRLALPLGGVAWVAPAAAALAAGAALVRSARWADAWRRGTEVADGRA